MTLTIVAVIAFLAHVAVWIGLPSSPAREAETELSGMVVEQIAS